MPDTKITALTAIGANPIIPSTFPIPMVDLTDTSMAASGTTKKVTVNQILQAGGTATLASATITGNLTVATNTLFVNSSTNNVGLGTLTPTGASGRTLEIYGGTGQSRLALKNDATGSANTEGSQIALIGSQLVIQNREASEITFETNGTERGRFDSSGNFGLGNVSPSARLDVAGNARVQLAFFTGGSIPGLTNDNPFAYRVPGGGLGLGAATETGTNTPIIFYAGQGGVEKVRIKAAGQVRFFPLASDPAGPEAGDVYYNSTSNKLKCYNGTSWNDLF